MATDRITGVVLRDGTIKSQTGSISGANHDNAENFFVRLKELTGGEETRESRGEISHDHSVSHTHQHEGGGHA
jgi:hypothetical protein